ncbi:MAG: D-sedoheptulose 7-phosphate isomerase [Bacteriovoracaceae bacterium]|jgi:D-sedoheptulose 7-phosphate isomerase
MNQVDKIFSNSNSPSEFASSYFNHLSEVLTKIDVTKVEEMINIILEARESAKMIYFIGNGGSAATASHFANDLSVGPRTTGKPFRVTSLTDNNAVMTAIANDFGYDELFTKQLESYLNEGDVVVAISASGNSPNVVKAIEYANSKSCMTIGLTGFDGGKLKEVSKLNLHVPSEKGEYGPVEDIHMIFDHVIGNYITQYCRKHD